MIHKKPVLVYKSDIRLCVTYTTCIRHSAIRGVFKKIFCYQFYILLYNYGGYLSCFITTANDMLYIEFGQHFQYVLCGITYNITLIRFINDRCKLYNRKASVTDEAGADSWGFGQVIPRCFVMFVLGSTCPCAAAAGYHTCKRVCFLV